MDVECFEQDSLRDGIRDELRPCGLIPELWYMVELYLSDDPYTYARLLQLWPLVFTRARFDRLFMPDLPPLDVYELCRAVTLPGCLTPISFDAYRVRSNAAAMLNVPVQQLNLADVVAECHTQCEPIYSNIREYMSEYRRQREGKMSPESRVVARVQHILECTDKESPNPTLQLHTYQALYWRMPKEWQITCNHYRYHKREHHGLIMENAHRRLVQAECGVYWTTFIDDRVIELLLPYVVEELCIDIVRCESEEYSHQSL